MKDTRVLLHFKFSWKPAPPKPEPVVPDTPGNAIKYYRMQKGIGIRTLVRMMHGYPTRSMLWDYERGRTIPPYSALINIAKALDIDPALMFDDYLVFIGYPYSEKIRKMQQMLSLTQTEMANALGIYSETVMNWELGRAVPNLESFEKLKSFCQSRGMELIEDDDYTEMEMREGKQKEKVINRPSRTKEESMRMTHNISSEEIAPPDGSYTIGELIWYYRSHRRLSREELSRLAGGLSVSSIARLEVSKDQPRYGNVLAIAKALKIDPVCIFDDYCAFIAYPCSKKLKEIRDQLHLTPMELAEQMNISHSTINRWESGASIPRRESFDLIRNFCREHHVVFDIKGIAVSKSVNRREDEENGFDWKHPNKARLITEADVDSSPVVVPDQPLTIGQAIMYYRKQRGVSRLQLMQLCKGTPKLAAIKEFENETETPRFETVNRIAKALKIDPRLLYDDYLKFIAYPCSKRIEEIRQELNLSARGLAKEFGVDTSSVYCWEKGDNYPSRRSYDLLAEYCYKNNISILKNDAGEENDTGREKDLSDSGTSETDARICRVSDPGRCTGTA